MHDKTTSEADLRRLRPISQVASWWAARVSHSVSPRSVWRACRFGLRSRSGVRVQLEHVRVGRRLYSSFQAVLDFERALRDRDLEHFRSAQSPTRVRSRRASHHHPRRERLRRADEELDRDGF